MSYPEPLVNRWTDTSKNTWDKILQHGVGIGGGTGSSQSKPDIDAMGRMILLAEEDHTWHYIYLFSDEGVRLAVDQAPQPPPGKRGFFIWEAADATRHRTQLALDEGSYTIKIEQVPVAMQPVDYVTLPLGISPAFTVFHNVTLVFDESYTEAVNQTPNP